jgi:carboxylesterase type B
VSEDCLKLNVWTGSAGVVDAKKPVLVFLHGGRMLSIRFSRINLTTSLGFQIPGPHSPFYNGQYLADAEDVVVVTFK